MYGTNASKFHQTRAQFILGETYIEELRHTNINKDAFQETASARELGSSGVIDGTGEAQLNSLVEMHNNTGIVFGVWAK